MKKRIILSLLFMCLLLVGCTNSNNGINKKGINGHKLTEKEIRETLEKDNPSSKHLVDTVTFATDNIKINDVEMKVSGKNVILGDYKIEMIGENNTLITGYYDKSIDVYFIYRLSKTGDGSTAIWSIEKYKDDPFEIAGWFSTGINNGSDLILVHFNKIEGVNDLNYKEYVIYTIVDNELKLVK